MTVNLATVTGTLETLTGAAPSLGRMWFRLNRPDWTLTGEIFAINIKDNFGVAHGASDFPRYGSMNAADTALLQVANNQKVT